jgi:hypothetical protein
VDQEDGDGQSRITCVIRFVHELRNEFIMDKTIEIEVNAMVEMSATVTIECAAGAPYQGNMRQLATDRWQFMYPSNS